MFSKRHIPFAKNKRNSNWVSFNGDMTSGGVERSFWAILQLRLGKDKYTATTEDRFQALAIAMRDRLIERWLKTQERFHKVNAKRVYYLSLEFLVGRLFTSNMLNLGLSEEIKKVADDLGFDLTELMENEPDPGLGNGGLGRLAACFLDSLATLGIPAHGYGIRYDYGIFKQHIVGGNQVEYPDHWLAKDNPWEFSRPEYTVRISFYGHTHTMRDENGILRVRWLDTRDVLARPYDIPVTGYKNDFVNTLRLWSARSSDEFDLEYFNHGDYARAIHDKIYSEVISKVLYPSDSSPFGKTLRLAQEYFFSAAAIADIIRRFKSDAVDIRQLPEYVAIQLNDTHPTIAIVELMRILIDNEGLTWTSAWDLTRRTFAYTNHTVMPEALEKWPVPLFAHLLPRHMELVYEINRRFLDDIAHMFPGDNDRLRRMSIIEETDPPAVRMAHLALIGTHSVNGVSKLHTELLKTELFKDFYEVFPQSFNNKTNGITQRRWLLEANPRLAALISKAIGDGWITDLRRTEKLLAFVDDDSFCVKWAAVKKENKVQLSNYIRSSTGIAVDPDSLFDVQVKRIHEYKRQLLFGLYIVAQYLTAKHNPRSFGPVRTFILGGKAAPGYFMAKRIITFLNHVAQVVNADKDTGKLMKVVFLEDYRVSLAEKIFPASDLSEQISTAGTEASGTGCMKFMLNGALTIGTYDGANIEIAEAVGSHNIFIFGLRCADVRMLTGRGYRPQEYIDASGVLREAIALIQSNFFCMTSADLFKPLTDNLIYSDPYCVCADFDDYYKTQGQAGELYRDVKSWTKKSIINVARSGFFSSDRAVSDYAKDIWKVNGVRI